MKIRRVKAESVREWCNHWLTCDDNSPVWEPNGWYWAVYDGDTIAAVAGMVRSSVASDMVYFHYAAVAAPYRGRGLQKRLIRVRLRAAKALGYTYARTYTFPDNPASSRSLIACGFKPYWPKYPWAGRQCYWLYRLA